MLVPFDLTTIDSHKESQEILVKRIINIGKSFISNSGRLKEGSAVLIAKLITRPDVVKSGVTDEVLQQFVSDYVENCNKTGTMTEISGILQTLVEVCKTGHRDDLVHRVPAIYDTILKPELTNKFLKQSSVIK